MIQMDNCLLALNHINKSLPKTFENFFQYSNNQHNHNTRDSSSKKIVLPQVKTIHYGLQSIKYRAGKDWNNIQQKLTTFNFEEDFFIKIQIYNNTKRLLSTKLKSSIHSSNFLLTEKTKK